MNNINNKLRKIQKIVNQLEHDTNLNTDQQLELLDELEGYIGENPLLIKNQSICLYNTGYSQEARKYLLESVKKHPMNYTLYELLYEMFRYTDDLETVSYSLGKMYKLSQSDEQRNQVIKIFEDILVNLKMPQTELTPYYDVFKKECISSDYRYFPIDEYGSSMIRTDAFLQRDSRHSYLINMYKSIHKTDIVAAERYYFLYEMIRGLNVKREFKVQANTGDIIAVSSAMKESVFTNLSIQNLEEASYDFKLEPNLIRYLKVKQTNEVVIVSDQDIFVSHFRKNELQNKPKLVIQIFVDGLSFQFLKDNGIAKLMPNTYDFFSKGYINSDCHTNGEWTLPSLMSMCTGKYTTNHYVYHTDAPHKGEQHNKLIQEYFDEAGYMTSRICPNWRGTPSYGYYKGINRFIYSPMIDRLSCGEVVSETIEHLEAFKDFPNYLWVTIEDLHSVADGFARGVLQDVGTEKYDSGNLGTDSEISVFRNYNLKKIEEYKSTIKKVDLYLGIIYDYIKKNYEEDEYIITLNSDHGQRFIEKQDYLFTHDRTNVPFMMRGRNVINKISDELISNVDIFPTLLKLCNCNLPSDIDIDGTLMKDFDGEERPYTITESIFPGQTYKLAINDKEHLFTFESKENTQSDGTIPIDEYSYQLLNRFTGNDETNLYPQKVELYFEVAFEHIKSWIHLIPQD